MDKELILSYVQEAILNQEQGKEIKPETGKAIALPPELETVFREEQGLHEAYYRLTPYKQREYAEYISEAKQAATRQRRLEKIKPLLREGIGLHDRYRKN